MPKYGKTPWLDYRCEVRLLSYTPHLITANKLVPFDSKHRSQAPMISSINPFFKFITVFYIVKEDCQARKLNTEDAMDHSKWMKLIKDVRWPGWERVGECFFWYRPTRVVPDQRPLNGCVCVCVCGVCVYFTLHTEKRVKQTCTCWWKSLQSWSHSSAGIHVQCVRGMHPSRQPASAHNAGLKSPRYGCCHDNIYTALCNSICIIYTLPFTFHIPPSIYRVGQKKTRAYTGYANVCHSYGFTGVECRSLKTV